MRRSSPTGRIRLSRHERRIAWATTDQLIRGDIPEEKLPSGITRIVRREFPPLPEQLPEVAEGVRMRMADR